ncbi:MAG: YceD family protein, partial [Cytophagaceae bacterium]
IELTCDRSMEQFDFNVDTNNSLIFKFGEEFAELTEEIITIPRDYPTLNMAQYIYEFIGLAIPMKKLHPKFVNEDELQDADTVLIYSSGEPEEAEDETTGEEDNDDPRWNILKNLRNNYN